MQLTPAALLGLSASLLPSVVLAEDVLGAFIFHRHGDRTAKAWDPVRLTALGADEVFRSGDFYRRRYLPSSSSTEIRGLANDDDAAAADLDVTSPRDPVLQNSATVFLQGLYPPAGDAVRETLANGSTVVPPLGGYQYIPVHAVDDAATANKAESNHWLQGASGCRNAEVSSNKYFTSTAYHATRDETRDFYQGLAPVVEGTYTLDDVTFKNAYALFDLINVAIIHNSSIPSGDLLTEDVREKLYDLASTHQWNLAYNAEEPVRAIAGSVLAGHILDALSAVVEPEGDGAAPKLTVEFGAYGTFMSFFGLAQLPAASSDFYGICDYASSMAFELVTNATDPAPEDVSVRFLFSNGTASADGLQPFPLFGGEELVLSWSDFRTGMETFAIRDTEHWCEICGNSGDGCPSLDSKGEDTSSHSGSSSGGVSRVVAGVIGALVTLVVVFTVQVSILALGGLRLVKKSKFGNRSEISTIAIEKA